MLHEINMIVLQRRHVSYALTQTPPDGPSPLRTAWRQRQFHVAARLAGGPRAAPASLGGAPLESGAPLHHPEPAERADRHKQGSKGSRAPPQLCLPPPAPRRSRKSISAPPRRDGRAACADRGRAAGGGGRSTAPGRQCRRAECGSEAGARRGGRCLPGWETESRIRCAMMQRPGAVIGFMGRM